MLNVLLTLVFLVLLNVPHWLLLLHLIHIGSLVLLTVLHPSRVVKRRSLVLSGINRLLCFRRSLRSSFLLPLLLKKPPFFIPLLIDPVFLVLIRSNHHNFINLVYDLLSSVIVAKLTAFVWLNHAFVHLVWGVVLNMLVPRDY